MKQITLKDLWEDLSSVYRSKTRRSEELFLKARSYLPGGVSYSLRYFEPYPFFVEKVKGAKIWDIDGNEYVDFWMIHGASLLGHEHPAIVEPLREKLTAHFGWTNPWEVKWAEAVTDWFKMDMVRPTNSGTEANMYATRLARAFTSRKKIGKFIGGWHGSYDGLHKGVSNLGQTESLGLDNTLQESIVLLKYNDKEETIERVLQGDLAGVVVEAVMGGAGALPADREFLHLLQDACKRSGTLFILDEVITGFRFYGGAKTYYDLDPDILVTGKAVGGSYFPGAGAILGKREVMELFDQVKHPEPEGRVFHGGTYTGNTLTMRAGYYLISYLKENRGLFDELFEKGKYLKELLRKAFEKFGKRVAITGLGSMIGFHLLREELELNNLRPEEIITKRDNEVMKIVHLWSVVNGFAYLSPSSPHLFISTAHTLEDLKAFAKSLEKLVKLL